MVSSLFFTTLIASFALSISAQDVASEDNIIITTPASVVQCKETTLDWRGGKGPYTVSVFTDCGDDNDDPIFVKSGLTDSKLTVMLPVLSGDGFFVHVEDSAGHSDDTDDVYVGGDAKDKDDCKAQLDSLAKKAAAASTSSAAPSTTSAPAASTQSPSDASLPTTMSKAITGNGVANAQNQPGGGTGVGSTTGTKNAGGNGLPTANGASTLSARPLTMGAGLLAIAVAAML